MLAITLFGISVSGRELAVVGVIILLLIVLGWFAFVRTRRA